MGIALEEVREVLPSIRLPEIGDYVTGHLMHMEMREEIDPDTKKVKLNDQGKPKKVQILSVLIVDATPGALIGSGEELQTPVAGDEGRIFIQGGTWKWWIEAKSSLKLEVGDVLRWKFDSITPNPNKRHNDFKNRKFQVRKSNASEQENVEYCERRYKQLAESSFQPDPVELSYDDEF